MESASDSVKFRCNICGEPNILPHQPVTREGWFCTNCRSTVRLRSVVDLLISEVLHKDIALPDIGQQHLDISGIGMSCSDCYAIPLSKIFDYKNTFFHKEPLLDITDIDAAMESTLDFIISSDVFEHVVPPISIAFENSYRLLKPNGVLILTVPYGYPDQSGVPTLEHFPDLYRYEILEDDGRRTLRNVTRTGQVQEFKELVFHGGAGETLEMRVFSEAAILEELRKAGFERIKIHSDANLKHGIGWEFAWSLPITARKPEK